MRFENQTAVVAACGSDAGAACALNYLQQGAKVALYYDEEARLWPFDQISEEERSRLLTIQISDFRDHEELKRAADQVKEKFGTCDIVVTAVTTVPSKPAYDMDEEEYDRVMKTITNGSLYTIQPLMPMMIEKNYGRIVLVSSIAGRTAIPGSHRSTQPPMRRCVGWHAISGVPWECILSLETRWRLPHWKTALTGPAARRSRRVSSQGMSCAS